MWSIYKVFIFLFVYFQRIRDVLMRVYMLLVFASLSSSFFYTLLVQLKNFTQTTDTWKNLIDLEMCVWHFILSLYVCLSWASARRQRSSGKSVNISFGLKRRSIETNDREQKKHDRKGITSNGYDFAFGDLQKQSIQFDPTVCMCMCLLYELYMSLFLLHSIPLCECVCVCLV